MIEILREINKAVNRAKPYSREPVDVWFSPREFDTAATVDCEDYAIKKFFHPYLNDKEDKWLAYCFIGGEAHMVCIVGRYVLDNMMEEVLSLDKRKDLTIVYQFNTQALKVNGHVRHGLPNIKPWRTLLNKMKREGEWDGN